MKIPNADRAIVDILKIRDYCLNDHHPRGKHKARLFKSMLGLTRAEADELQNILLKIVQTHHVIDSVHDQYGKRYIIDFLMKRSNKQATIRSSWIIRNSEDFPRLTSCYVLKK